MDRPPHYFLGLDGGGTKTEALILNDAREVIATAKVGASNPYNASVAQSLDYLIQAASQARSAAETIHNTSITINRACIGMASLNMPEDFERFATGLKARNLDHELFGTTLLVVNDAYAGFVSTAAHAWGICIVAGTGAHVYGVSPTGVAVSAGDWSYLLGDQHSGFALGQKIAQEVLREYDGRTPPSPLTPAVLTHLHLSNTRAFYAWANAHPNPVPALASLAILIDQPALSALPFIVRITKESVLSLVHAFRAVYFRLHLDTDEQTEVILTGGLFNSQQLYLQPVMTALHKIMPQVHLIHATHPPAYGAASIAYRFTENNSLPHPSLILDV